MNKQGQIEFSMELLIAIAFGIGAAFISLIVMKGSPTSGLWKILTFILTAAAGTAVSYFIFNKD